MSRISMTIACASALEEACWITRSSCTGDLLSAALDGNQAALEAIADEWPADTAGERTDFVYVRAEVLERLAEVAHDAPEQPRRRGPKGAGVDGISELLRRHSGL
ncbi:MAG: hypothetical protein GY838_12855 [bacterium]|nr:hypothetical protein [bacterium]